MKEGLSIFLNAFFFEANMCSFYVWRSYHTVPKQLFFTRAVSEKNLKFHVSSLKF